MKKSNYLACSFCVLVAVAILAVTFPANGPHKTIKEQSSSYLALYQ